jgi:hypothetical protein
MNWEAKIITHRKEKRIAVYFEKNAELIARIKLVEGSRWSQALAFGTFQTPKKTGFGLKLPLYHTLFLQRKVSKTSKNSNNAFDPNATAKTPSIPIAKP